MDDGGLTQLFARMDAHLERQDTSLQGILQTLARQNDLMVEMARALLGGQAVLAVLAEIQRSVERVATMTVEVLRRTPER